MSASPAPAINKTGAATSLILDTPAQASPGARITITGTYQGNPQALDYSFGAGWIAAPQTSFDSGTFSFTLPGGLPAGTYTPLVRDHAAQSVISVSASFLVSAWNPEALTSSPGASAVFEFDANDPDLIAGAAGAAVASVDNALDRAQSLTAMSGRDGNPIVIADDSGADGRSRVLRLHPTTDDPNFNDPATNWLDAGGVDGPAGSALAALADSSDLSAGPSFTTIIAMKIDPSSRYVAGPIWGALASPGPLQYVQLRANGGSRFEGADLAASGQSPVNAQGSFESGWHVLTMIKDGNQLSYRIDGKAVASSTITSTESFTASDFMIGGGFPQGPGADLNHENGVPPSDIGDFQAYRGVLAGSDLADAEGLAASSIGISLSAPTAPAGNMVIVLGANPTVCTALSGDTVYGGVGPATVNALSGPVLMVAGAGTLQFIGGSAASTVLAGSGSTTLIGGIGGGNFTAGTDGNSILVASGGSTTLTGGAAGDRLFGSATGHDVMVAARGRESLVGGNADSVLTGGVDTGAVIFTQGNSTVTGGLAGGDTVVGGAGMLSVMMNKDAVFAGSGQTVADGGSVGADSIIGGSGSLSVTGHGSNMLVVAGSASSNIVTGNGASLVFSGAGNATVQEGNGAASVVLGSGNARILEGQGAITYDVVHGSAGGTDLVAGFRPGVDHIALFGYGPASTKVDLVGANSVISLSDGTRITLLGVTDPGSSII